MAYIDVPVSKLTLSSRYQARKAPGQQSIEELADSIHAQGLLQNLVVVKGKKGMFEVVAGGRRMRALKCLLTDGRWPKDKTVPALQIESSVALEASITENVQRENMHPADEFEAFNELIKAGKTVEYVAARFAVTPVYVQRRMKLASVAPELIAAYRDGEMTLELLTAFTVCDDKEKQMQVWLSLPEWQHNPNTVKSMLRREALTARSALVQFVGLDAYSQAGGTVTRDLFSEDNSGIYIDQPELVHELAQAKLAQTAESYKAAGWGWVETRLNYDYDEWRSYGRIYPQKGELTDEQQAQVAELSKKYEEAADRLSSFEEEHDGDESEEIAEQWNELSEAVGQIEEQIDAIRESAPNVWPEGMQAVAGVVLSVSYGGKLHVTEGLIKREDREEAKEAAAGMDDTGSVSLPAHSRRPAHSEKLVRQLSANKTAIVQAAMADSPHVALAVFVAQLAVEHFGTGYDRYRQMGFGLGVHTRPESLADAAPDYEQSRAGQELARIRQEWFDRLPKTEDGLGDVLTWALEQDIETLVKLQAYLIADTVQGIQSQEPTKATAIDRLAGLLSIRMYEWWEPTAESYLSRVPKDRIIEVVTEVAGAEAAEPLHKMKKGEAVSAAEQLLSGRGWLPEIMQIKEDTHA